MSEYQVAIASRGRSSSVTTLKNTDLHKAPATIFVDSDEESESYRAENYPADIVVTNTSGIHNVRNFMLDYYGKGAKVLTMCDDVKGVFVAIDGAFRQLKGPELHRFIIRGFGLCEQNNCGLWGVYPIKNAFWMKDKLSARTFIIGTFAGIIVSELRHDPDIPLKEDYDFTIQHILRDGKVIRFDQYCVEAAHYKNKGGCVDYRTTELEQKAITALIKKYPRYVRLNPKRKNEILLRFPKK